jgi:arabinogalactan oligomer/maltooligosaccharide transport system substrate-binding protein
MDRPEKDRILSHFPHDNIGDTVLKGLIRPVELKENLKGQYSASAIQAMTYEGKLYGLPKATESVALIYNKKADAQTAFHI